MLTSKWRNSEEAGWLPIRLWIMFHDITRCIGLKPNTVVQIWNQCVAEGHTERHVGPPHSHMNNTQGERHIVRQILQNHSTR
ncbi:hypothetical protein TNCV_3672211 [Trichonephila clavipes]|nr:hypothetical protein TNCV_3672211 [Trichonephila clavipes]